MCLVTIDPKDLSIHDEVLVETEIEGIAVHLPAFVTNVLPEELWLCIRSPDHRLLYLREHQRVHLTFDRDGALIADSEFLRRLNQRGGMEEKSRVFAVSRPKGVDQIQRRAHVRADVDREVRIRSLSASGPEIGAGRTVNLGAGGVQLTTPMVLRLGDQLRLAIVLAPRDIVIAGGPIIRIDSASDSTPGEPNASGSRVAVRFDTIAEADQERISCFVLALRRQTPSTAEPAGADSDEPSSLDRPSSATA